MLKTYQMRQFSQMNSIEAAHSSNYGCKHIHVTLETFLFLTNRVSHFQYRTILLAKRTILYTFPPYTSRKWVSLSNYNNTQWLKFNKM